MKLPLYKLVINDTEDSGVDAVAFVDNPAIEKNWIAFKMEFESYNDYPDAAKENAKIALRYAEENGWGDCGTSVGKARANQLANGEALSRDTIARMAAFERHRQNSQKPLGDGCGRLMWLAWGGDEGIAWAQRKLAQIDKQNMFADLKISFDYDETLSTARGKELAKRLIAEGDTIYIISARNDKQGMLSTAQELGIPESRVYATGSNQAKVEKIKELGINRHYDNNADVVDALGNIGEKFVKPQAGESEQEYISRCIAHEVGKGYEQSQAAAICYSTWQNYNEAIKPKFKADPQRRIVTGAMMLADTPIYRNQDGQEFMVQFDKYTIEKIVQKFFKQGKVHNVNENHNTPVDGVYMFESFITDKSRGIQAPKGYPNVPDGSWIASYKVENEEVWKSVLDGTFRGFSVEGAFNKIPVKLSKTAIEIEVDEMFKDL